MIANIKKWWKYSTLRFYIINALWNYNFWLRCTKEYHIIEYYHFESPRQNPNFEFFSTDTPTDTGQLKSKKRFLGYKYKGQIYMDNPGLQIEDKDLWMHWHKKGLL